MPAWRGPRSGAVARARAGRRARTARPRPFVAVSWDTALDLVAAELRQTRRARQRGDLRRLVRLGERRALPPRPEPAAPLPERVRRLHGSVNSLQPRRGAWSCCRTSSATPRTVLRTPHALGPTLAEHTELFVAFGGIPPKNAPGQPGRRPRRTTPAALRALAAGRGPVRQRQPAARRPAGGRRRRLAPGPPEHRHRADAGACAHAVVEGLHDRAFLARYLRRLRALRAYLLGEHDGIAEDAAWAAAISGVAAEAIRALARRMAATRTMITRHLVAAARRPRRAARLDGDRAGRDARPDRAARRRLRPRLRLDGRHRRPGADRSGCRAAAGHEPGPRFIPVARIADMLLRPGRDRSTTTASGAPTPTSASSTGPAATRSTITRT